MSVLASVTGHALAELSAVLTAGPASVDVVLDRAARAAAEVVGDAGGLRLLGEDGRYDRPVVHAGDPGQARRIADLLDTATLTTAVGDLHTTRRPVLVPPGDGPAMLLCPLVDGDVYLGYLALARTGDRTAAGYTTTDIALADDLAQRVSTALSAGRSMTRLHVIEQQYRSIVETTREGVWQLDVDGVTTFANAQLAAILGLQRDRLLGRPVSEFLDARGQAELTRRLGERHDGYPEVYETRLIGADGTGHWVQVSAAPTWGEDGVTAGSLLMVTDISERVHARELKRQLDHLRRLDSLGQLVGGIAHDFKNLFTVIAGSAEVIAEATHHQLATQIVDATVRGRALTHQLLAFGRGGGRPEVISVADLLDDIQQLLSRTLGERIRLDVRIEHDLWPVRAERGPLEQVVVNLAVNARDAMSRGGTLLLEAVNCVVQPGQLSDPAVHGSFVRLAVSDTGTGMSEETRERAFEPFFSTKPTAAGLGLTTAASLIRGGGGHVDLQSERGIGTTVQLYLARADQPAADAAAPATDQTPRRGNILVVEDQRELAELIRYLLQPAGYTVRVVTTVGEAIAHVNAGVDPDLLLTDVVMPGMTGPELAAALRARKPELRVLYMSGYSTGELGWQGEIEHGNVLIQKPFNRATLLAAVELALITPAGATPPAAN